MSLTMPSAAVDAGTSSARIDVLDVLRGIALLGMFLVHFNDQATGSDAVSGLSAIYQKAVTLFFEERFWTMFGILFGVGFAVQLRRAEARGGAFALIYLRRLATLAGFGLCAHAVFGYHVLLEYAMWGLPLLLVRRWSVKGLVLAVLISAASGSLSSIARASYGVSRVGDVTYRSELARELTWNRAFNEANREAQRAPDYVTVFTARLRHMAWFYRQPFFFLPVNTFTLFLIGVIGLRLGLFERPEEHQRRIVTLMVFGTAAWAAEAWLLPARSGQFGDPPIRELMIIHLKGGFGLIRDMWLAFAYIGAVLLLVAHHPTCLRRLAAFAWTGRMALTNYMVQIVILDLVFSHYSLGLELTPLEALGAGLAFFGVNAVLSRWWLARFRFGPLEWIWRSITYGHSQPWRVRSDAPAVQAV